MSHKHTIKCETFELENPYGTAPITIKNKYNDAALIFDEPLQFNKSVNFVQKSMTLGAFEIKVDGENLVIQKNGTTIFTFGE